MNSARVLSVSLTHLHTLSVCLSVSLALTYTQTHTYTSTHGRYIMHEGTRECVTWRYMLLKIKVVFRMMQ